MTVIVVALLAAVIIICVSAVSLRSGVKREQLSSLREQRGIAENALRSIAADSGNPRLEAQIALDEINNIYQKELNK